MLAAKKTMAIPSIFRLAIEATVIPILGTVAAVAVGFTVGELVTFILAIELAQFPVLFHIHGRLSSVETVIEDEHDRDLS